MKEKQIRIKKSKKYPDGVVKIKNSGECKFYGGIVSFYPEKSEFQWICKFDNSRKVDSFKPKQHPTDIICNKCPLEDYGTGLPRDPGNELPGDEDEVLLKIKIKNKRCYKGNNTFYVVGYYGGKPKKWLMFDTNIDINKYVESWQPLPGEEG